MGYHVLRATLHLAEQMPIELGHKLTGCQANKLTTLQPVGEILGKCGVDNVHMTFDELSCCSHKGNKRPMAMDEAPLRELVVESAKYEAPRRWSFTGVTAPFVVQPTTATNGLPTHQESLVLQATPHILEHKTSGSENTKQIPYNRQSDSGRLCCGFLNTRLCSGP